MTHGNIDFGSSETAGGVTNLYKNQGNLHIHYYGKKDIQITAEINYTNNPGCQDIQLGK